MIDWLRTLPTWAVLWLLWILTGIVLEIVALADRVRGNTLSRQVWSAAEVPVMHAVVTTFLVWVAYHWIFEQSFGLRTQWQDDVLVILIGVLCSLVVQMGR